MRVPIRRQPGTRVTPITEGFQRASATPDFTPITNAIRGFAKELEDEQKGMEEFDLQKRLMQETNELQADFAKRQEEAPLGAAGFTDTVLADYETRHTAILDEYDAKGYSRELLQGTAVRLGSLRQQFGERALVFQQGSMRGLATKNLEEFKVGVSQYVTNNPFDGWESGVAEFSEAVDRLPGLNAVERETFKQKGIDELRAAAGKGAAIANPQLIIEKLDPKGLTAPAAAVAPGASGGAYGILKGWQAVPTTVAAKYGLDPTEVAAVMSFESAGTFDPNKKGGDGGRYQGLIQAGPEERAKYGIDPSLPPEEYAASLIRFFDDRGFKPGMGIEDFYSTILTGSPGNYDRQDSNGTSVRKVIRDITTGDHRKNAEKWLRAAAPIEDANALGAEPASLNPFDPGASSVPQAPDPATLVAENDNPATTQTGIALLDAMNGAERLQVVGWAREQLARKNVSNKAAYDVAQNNIDAALETSGEYAGPIIPAEQFIAEFGPVIGAQKFAEQDAKLAAIGEMQKIKTQSPEQIDAAIAAMKPDPKAEDYGPRQRIYAAMQTARDKILDQRAKDPAAYVYEAFPDIRRTMEAGDAQQGYAAIERAYEQLGVPESQRFALTEDQMERLASQYKVAQASEKINILEGAMRDMGYATAGRTLGRAIGAEVAQDFGLYSTLITLPNAKGIMARVFEGNRVMKEDPARRPPEGVVTAAFRKELGGAINNVDAKYSRMIREAAIGIYVESGGYVEGNGQNAVVNKDKFTSAVRQAVGGMATNPDTGIVKLPGAIDFTILPPGVSGAQMENWIESLTPGDLTRLSLSGSPMTKNGKVVALEDIVDQGTFVMVAPGVYAVAMKDGRPLADSKTGKPFKFRLDKKTMGLR